MAVNTDDSYVVVAIPAEDDPVWRYSSEKVPHLTILYLGANIPNMGRVQDFIGHAVDTSLQRFGIVVDRRGMLGDDNADVLFLDKEHAYAKLDQFRQNLLTDVDIFTAYHSVTQYPEWTPHVTMGYPATPAKKDDRDYPGISWIKFDRIALWTGDYEGVEYLLKDDDNALHTSTERGAAFLEHYGVKGMHWGQRKAADTAGPTEVTVRARPGKMTKATGGSGHPAHDDAVRVAVARQKARRSSTDSLSTKDLQDLVNRMNLEQQYSRLATTDPHNKSDVQKYLDSAIKAGKTYSEIKKFLDSPAGKLLKTTLKAKLGK